MYGLRYSTLFLQPKLSVALSRAIKRQTHKSLSKNNDKKYGNVKADLDQLVKTRKIWKEEKNEELLGKITKKGEGN